jgi:glycosyltransferase involved in cell wall biosynthesis
MNEIKSPKVSVILTSFNHEKYIQESIESVLNQTYIDWELIVLDDRSSDNSWNLIKSYTDNRIRSFQSNASGEFCWRLNNAINELALGEYIAIHHSDDVWEINKLNEQMKFIENNPKFGAVFTWLQVIDEDGRFKTNAWTHEPNKKSWEWLNQIFLFSNKLGHPSMLIRKECYEKIGCYKQYLWQTPDVEFYTRLLFKYDIHVISRTLTKHRLFSNNSNVSGERIDSKLRTRNEWSLIRENYLSIDNFESLIAIFPSLKKFQNPYFFNVKFLLAIVCLNECEDNAAKMLGIKWLLDSFSDPDQADKIIKYYSFTYNDLIEQTGKFGFINIHKRDSLIAKLNLINNSISWKLTLPLRLFKKYVLNLKSLCKLIKGYLK